MAKPDWSRLPTELLQLISQKLNSDFYLLRFRSVCSKWRSSIPNYRRNNHLRLKLPKPFSNDNNNKDSICYLLKHNIFLIKPTTIPIPISHKPQNILQPLLIRIGPNVNGNKTHLWHPLDLDQRLPFNFPRKVVFDFNQISIVDLGHVFVLKTSDSLRNNPYHKVVAATYPGEQQPHFVVTYDYWHQPCMFRPGDDGWMEIRKLSSHGFGDICNFKGRTCVVDVVDDATCETAMVGPDSSVDLVATEMICLGQQLRLCVVESELLLVETTSCDYDASIDVYRLDEKKKKWVELSNLGDRVLFLGKKCSFSASASDLGFAKGNCVINTDVSDLGCGICDLNLDENQILPLSDYPDYFKLLAASGLDRAELHLEQEFDEDEESEDEDEESEEEEDEESGEEEDEESEEEDDEEK